MSKTRLQIPDHIRAYVTAEHCDDFPISRFYITDMHKEIVQDVLHAQKVREGLLEYGIAYLNATLLYGVPGTGKTTFGRYIAYCLDMDCVYINFAKLYDGVLGSTAGRISDIFQYMAHTKAIFLLDEIDAISQKRGTENAVTGGEISRITITIMQELDLMKRNHTEAVIIGCTNRVDIMDPALKNRFPIKKDVKPLNVREKQEYISMYLTDLGVMFSPANIKDYCSANPGLPQRSVEDDINRCMIRWIENGKSSYLLDHIKEYE